MLLPAVLLALALAADAFAASLCQGVATRELRPHATALTVGAAFGAAQGLAPLLGWTFGLAFAQALSAIDHWIAFGILALLAGKLLHDGATQNGCAAARPARGWALAALAVATSLDAAAAGLALDALRLPPLVAAVLIAAVTFALSTTGVYAGRAVGARLGARAEVFGGVALLAVAVKILVDHRAFG